MNSIEKEIKHLFDVFDKDGSERIDSKELTDLLHCIGENPTEAEVEDLIRIMDTDHSGYIEWEEFYTEMQKRMSPTDIEKEVEIVFNLFDQSGKQTITSEDVLFVMNTIFKENMTINDAQDMVRVVAGSRPYITYEEFKKVLTEGII